MRIEMVRGSRHAGRIYLGTLIDYQPLLGPARPVRAWGFVACNERFVGVVRPEGRKQL